MIGCEPVLMRGTIYHNRNDQTGVQTHILVSELEKDSRFQALPVFDINVDPEHGERVIQKNGLEQHRMARVLWAASYPVENEKAPNLTPIMAAEWDDGTFNIIDGNHRYAAAYLCGWKWIKAKLIPMELWREYEVGGWPDEEWSTVVNRFSGIR